MSLGEGVTPHAIGNRLSLTTGSVTALLDRLQSAALIERQANPEDRRSLLIVATAAGRRMTEDFLAILDRVVTTSVAGIDPSMLFDVNGVVAQITDALCEQAVLAPGDVGGDGGRTGTAEAV